MKYAILLAPLFFYTLTASADSLSCVVAIQKYDQSGSEVAYNSNRQIALKACSAEVAKYPEVAKLVAPLLVRCNELDDPRNPGDTGPHLAESCKLDAYRYAIAFE